MKGYNHLSIMERENIAKFQAQGLSKREISRRINRSHSTVIRELNRLKEEYSPSKAQAQYIKIREENLYSKLILKLENMLNLNWNTKDGFRMKLLIDLN